ncbi:hypothetical membrane protein, conserved [Thermococcus kodakarensis KOD1]|uniref:Hypothetical membrane protein, conserved n=2 Tax=Thermococcus TaxID=2263 RepID=Q5JG09_THEKO|nr:hypothetical protein [Thermococcus kodakarensis]WCN30696.1 hypothetical protein POG21_01645 [Thermococcus kodakarensis]BAD84512.1 hypothetical membrane protein, conserved [Thermococcus kodakarensis KOD1]
MKRDFLAFPLVLILTLPAVSAAPYWTKPGVYIEYAAMRYEPYIQYRLSQGDRPEWIQTSLMVYNYSGVLYILRTFNDTIVEFRLKKERDYIRSNVQVTLYNVSISTTLPKDISPPVFWNESEVIETEVENSHDLGFEDWKWYRFHVKKVVISGEYLIRVKDYHVIKGNMDYGHTMLFDDPANPLNKGNSFSLYPISIKIQDARIDNERVLKGRYTKFYPPTKTVVTGAYALNITQPFGKGYNILSILMGTLIYTFDASDGKLIATYNDGPDLWAVGILDAQFTDEYGQYKMEVEHEESYASGLVLRSFKIARENVKGEVSFNKPIAKAAYLFYASLVLLGLGLVLNIKASDKRGGD